MTSPSFSLTLFPTFNVVSHFPRRKTLRCAALRWLSQALCLPSPVPALPRWLALMFGPIE